MKIKLLNAGGYRELKNVKFPVEVIGFSYGDLEHCVGVTGCELLRVGGEDTIHSGIDLAFLIGEECEIVDE